MKSLFLRPPGPEPGLRSGAATRRHGGLRVGALLILASVLVGVPADATHCVGLAEAWETPGDRVRVTWTVDVTSCGPAEALGPVVLEAKLKRQLPITNQRDTVETFSECWPTAPCTIAVEMPTSLPVEYARYTWEGFFQTNPDGRPWFFSWSWTLKECLSAIVSGMC